MEQEKSRQIQKAFQNAIGDFHQDIISAVPGWENAGKGGDYDVSSESAKVIAEIKNKHNTMNSTSAAGTYDKLAGWLDHGKEDFTAYVVAIIPKNTKPFSEPFTPSQRKVRRPTRSNLLKIDGKSFYALVTGREDALEKLYEVLPTVLEQTLDVDDELLKGTAEFRKLFDKAYTK